MLLLLLENSVSQWPTLDGRFACFSGIKFSFDPDQPAGFRVHSVTNLANDPLDLSEEATYTMATKEYLVAGRDGYTAFTDPSVKMLSDAYGAMPIQDIIVSAFEQFSPSYKPNPKREGIREQRR